MIDWDIFCSVVDNYGDIGVCWRLAQSLAHAHQFRVRLWVDDLRALAALRGPFADVDPAAEVQQVAGVTVVAWTPDCAAARTLAPGRAVVEAFACTLPPAWLERIRDAQPQPVWINLEYLSAEDWVEGCHRLPSPQPGGLSKFFFFPGFTPATGGLLREADAEAWLDAASPRPALPQQLPVALTGLRNDALRLSLFCYDNPALPSLLDAWRDGAQRVDLLVCAGLPAQAVVRWLGRPLTGDTPADCGALRLFALPFVAQPAYDALLRHCDVNFVRGEDSLVRALWAGRPLLWQLYPQVGDAHLGKLDAFAPRYLANAPDAAAAAWHRLAMRWNQGADCRTDWSGFAAQLPALAAHGWAAGRRFAQQPELAAQLVAFVAAQSRAAAAGDKV